MLTIEYIIHGSTDITIAIVSDLHEHDPAPVLSIPKEVGPDVIAVPGDLFENHEFGENLDKEDESLISRLLCSVIHYTNSLAQDSITAITQNRKTSGSNRIYTVTATHFVYICSNHERLPYLPGEFVQFFVHAVAAGLPARRAALSESETPLLLH